MFFSFTEIFVEVFTNCHSLEKLKIKLAERTEYSNLFPTLAEKLLNKSIVQIRIVEIDIKEDCDFSTAMECVQFLSDHQLQTVSLKCHDRFPISFQDILSYLSVDARFKKMHFHIHTRIFWGVIFPELLKPYANITFHIA